MWILAAKLPNFDLNFAVDFLVDFFLLFVPRKKARKNPQKNPPQNSPGTFFGKIPLGFLQKPLGGSFSLTARSFLLTVGVCYLRWSFLLTVKIWFGLFYLRLNYGLVFFAYGGKSVWSFLLTVLLVQGIGFGLFYLRFPYRK